jgi:cyclopropane fatty-acyl-phospholipid synthase-like methyltransferase
MKKLTDKEFFDAEISMGITPDNPDYLRLHYNLGQMIIDRFKPKRTLEIGAGVGTCLEYLLKNDVEAWAIDLNPFEKEFFDNRNPGFKDHYKIMPMGHLNGFLVAKVDVLISIEVMEHITDAELLEAIPYLAQNCKYFLFSSTPDHTDWDYAWGHINVKSEAEWLSFFSPWFTLEEKLTQPTTWTLLFKNKVG